MKTKTQSNPWAALDALMKTDPEPTGPEWFTTDDFAERYKLTVGGAAQRLKALVTAGKLKKWKGYVRGSGCSAPKCKYKAA